MNTLLFIVFSAIAVSWGWGMRGTLIGGEKGAMLPGALMGLAIAMFSGSDVLIHNCLALAGVGAMSMYCGGCMTYGETLNFSMASKPAPNLKKGLTALFVKGAAWFGVFGGLTSMYISVLGGHYSLTAIIVFITLLPISAIAGYIIFNKPYNPQKNIYPKIYFSYTRHESWGGLIGIIVQVLAFTIIFFDKYSALLTVLSSLIGGVGWVIAQLMQIAAKFPNKRGKQLFDKLNKSGYIDSWKIMECVLGMIAGAGIAASFVLADRLFPNVIKAVESNIIQPLLREAVTSILLYIYISILLIDQLQFLISPHLTKSELKKRLELTTISKQEYDNAIVSAPERESVHYTRYRMLCEKCEFPIYSILPLSLCFLGCYKIAVLASAVTVAVVPLQELCEKLTNGRKTDILIKNCIILVIIAVIGLQFSNPVKHNIFVILLVCTVYYEIISLIADKYENKAHKRSFSKSKITVHGYFILCIILIFVIALAYFPPVY